MKYDKLKPVKTDEANETDGNGRTDEYKKKACKAFS